MVAIAPAGALGIAVALPSSWTTTEPADHGRTASWLVRGGRPGEGFAAVRMTGADADSELADWLDLPMSVTGGMDAELLAGVDPTEVVEVVTWHEEDGEIFAEQLGADEAVVRSGLLRVGEELLRTYVVLARIGDVAWKTALTLADAAGPEAADDEVDERDHARARDSLGSLTLTP